MLFAIYATSSFLSLFVYTSTRLRLLVLQRKIVKNVDVTFILAGSSTATTKSVICLATAKEVF